MYNTLFQNTYITVPGDGLGSQVCYSPWDHKESDRTEWLNWTEQVEQFSESSEMLFLGFNPQIWLE